MDLNDLTRLAQTAKNTVNQVGNIAQQAHRLAVPIQIQNLQTNQTDLTSAIDELEKLSTSLSSQPEKLAVVRTNLQGYYIALQQGGHPDPSPAIKLHPLYSSLLQSYTQLDQKLTSIETNYFNCTFGYKLPDGKIYHPTTDWTVQQWQAAQTQAMHGTARCWKNDNPEEYLF